jgi:hypothetical protein
MTTRECDQCSHVGPYVHVRKGWDLLCDACESSRIAAEHFARTAGR